MSHREILRYIEVPAWEFNSSSSYTIVYSFLTLKVLVLFLQSQLFSMLLRPCLLASALALLSGVIAAPRSESALAVSTHILALILVALRVECLRKWVLRSCKNVGTFASKATTYS